MKISFGNKIVLGFAVALFALASLAWLSYRTTRTLITSQNWVAHTHEVIGSLEAGLAILTDAETSQRGYLLTSDERFLTDSREAQGRVRNWLDTTRALTADSPEQQQRLTELESLIAQRLTVLNDRIRIRQEQGLQAAAEAVNRRQGTQFMDRIWELISAMRDDEKRLLATRTQTAQATASRSMLIIGAGSALASCVGFAGLVVIRRDLRRRERAEKDLQENRALLQSFFDNSPAVVFLKDLQGRYLLVNRRFAELAGRPGEDILGKTAFDLFPEPIAKIADANDQAVRRAANPVHCEETVVYPDGPHTHLAIKFPLSDSEGRVYATGAVSSDINDRKLAEAERDRFFTISRDMICIAGFDGYFKRLNPAWEQTLGYTTQELQGRPFIEFLHPDDVLVTNRESARLAGGGEVVSFENRYRHKDGSYRWLVWNARSDPARNLIYASARDVTKEKESSQQIQAVNEQLREANKELESFSYSVSHDLRAPLRHIDGFVKLLDGQARVKLDERGQRYLTIIADSAKQMGALIDDLLAFSRMARTELRHSRVDFNSLVQETVELLKTEANGRSVVWKIAALPEVAADHAMLRQVWVNLIANALKYSRPRSPAEIEIGCSGSDNGEHVFFVRDNGVGFDMQYAHKLFGVFQRLHRPDEFEGTGIGLANVSRIVHRHGGRVWAEGKLEGGATFYFSLPKTSTATKG